MKIFMLKNLIKFIFLQLCDMYNIVAIEMTVNTLVLERIHKLLRYLLIFLSLINFKYIFKVNILRYIFRSTVNQLSIKKFLYKNTSMHDPFLLQFFEIKSL